MQDTKIKNGHKLVRVPGRVNNGTVWKCVRCEERRVKDKHFKKFGCGSGPDDETAVTTAHGLKFA